jgi:8-oxo-dGTP pyrophosphatase MutT (NUDIX family)
MEEQFLRATISIRGVVCRDDETVLTLRRASDGGWELPGGRIHRAEPVEECLRREIAEETGLAVTVKRTGDDRFAVYYHCTTAGDAISLSPEHTASEWVPEAAALDRLSEPQAVATERALSARAAGPPVGEN